MAAGKQEGKCGQVEQVAYSTSLTVNCVALRAILNYLVPNGEVTLPENADVEKLAERLDELLANKGGLNAYMNVPRDDQGRVGIALTKTFYY